MKFEWDDLKARRNAAKHGVSFKIATYAFDDPHGIVIDDNEHSLYEIRQLLVADSIQGILTVSFTTRSQGQIIRIINARQATHNERRVYNENKGG
ncbi:MAG: hypothetical protein A2901_01950 [Elusimicrobia bacterium RIFCSPLOWO2_01_FULL_54_10]|nr:MAG: hypothetical protein A2901_01950 [Elusimicrobia bacterium RIFCSPLOWO2_01_FULL_54_10]